MPWCKDKECGRCLGAPDRMNTLPYTELRVWMWLIAFE
jgi:hypothetical protein